MGIFDALTGSAARRAAAENATRLNTLRTDGMSYLDAGKSGALGALGEADAAFTPLAALGDQFKAAPALLLDALGVNGAEGSARGKAAFTTSPGYDAGIDAGIDVLNRRRAADGMLASGNADLDALTFGQNKQNEQWGNWLSNLGQFINPALSATSGAAAGRAGVAGAEAGVHTGDAANRLNLATGVTNNLNSNTTQRANAETAASGNLLGLGMNLLTAGAGGGGSGGLFGSLFGGGSQPSWNSSGGNGAGGYNYPVFR